MKTIFKSVLKQRAYTFMKVQFFQILDNFYCLILVDCVFVGKMYNFKSKVIELKCDNVLAPNIST